MIYRQAKSLPRPQGTEWGYPEVMTNGSVCSATMRVRCVAVLL